MNELSHAQRHELIASCLKLAHWIAAKFARRHPEILDDLHGEALLALVRATYKFNPQHPTSNWPGLARTYIEGALNGFLRREYTRQERFLKVEAVDDQVDPVDVLTDPGPGPEVLAGRAELAQAVRHTVGCLPGRQRDVVRLRYFTRDHETLADVGRTLGVTREGVRQAQIRAFRRLRLAVGTTLLTRSAA